MTVWALSGIRKNKEDFIMLLTVTCLPPDHLKHHQELLKKSSGTVICEPSMNPPLRDP